MQSIINKLDKHKDHLEEFDIFLGIYSDTAEQIDENTIVKGNFILKYDKSGDIANIYFQDGTQKLLKEIITKYDELYLKQLVKKREVIIFNNYKVNGFFKSEKFKILPLNKKAPMPHHLAGHWPCLLEVKYKSVNNSLINLLRSQKATIDIILFLNTIIFGGIKAQIGYATSAWVTCHKEGQRNSEFCQVGYVPQEAESEDLRPLKKIEFSTYYNQYGFNLPNSELMLPDNIHTLIDLFFSLDNKQKEMYLRSSHWEMSGRISRNISRSLFYQSYVNAIEALTESTGQSGNCSECKKPMGQSRSSEIKDMLSKNATWLSNSEINKIYQMRSALTHGAKLRPSDYTHYGLHFNTLVNNARGDEDQLVRILRIVFING